MLQTASAALHTVGSIGSFLISPKGHFSLQRLVWSDNVCIAVDRSQRGERNGAALRANDHDLQRRPLLCAAAACELPPEIEAYIILISHIELCCHKQGPHNCLIGCMQLSAVTDVSPFRDNVTLWSKKIALEFCV